MMLTASTVHGQLTSDGAGDRPNIVLVMADDQGWGETGYYRHPVLKTPHLDAMAANGLRFDRFYAAAPVCSPTRASVLTGRSNRRTGVESHGYALRLQERTLPQALRKAGYATGHFGKWHLNGLRGPGVPILADDSHHPGVFGFEHWLSVTNFFDRDPLLSRRGTFEAFAGDSSEIIVDEAMKFITEQKERGRPFLAVIWYGTPHSPFRAAEADKKEFGRLNQSSQDHYGELVAMDRSIGALRKGLRALNIADNTLLWFCSDNGGLPKITPATTGGLRDFKGSLYEGGLRVPAILEWPARIHSSRITSFPATTSDIFPTVAAILKLPSDSWLTPQDGSSLTPLLDAKPARRDQPLMFSTFGKSAIIDNDWKLVALPGKKSPGARQWELYHLAEDISEANNLASTEPERLIRLKRLLEDWESSVERSVEGKDYEAGRVLPGNPAPRFWTQVDGYKPYFDEWRSRPEYSSRLKK